MVKRYNSPPTNLFWTFTGLAIFILSVGVSWSLIRASTYKVETDNHKLEVNSAVNKVKKVSGEITEKVESLPISNSEKQQLKQDLEKADNKLTEINQKILNNENNNSNGGS